MSYVSQVLGGGIQATKNLYNAFSTAGYTALSGISTNALAKNSVSGSLTANTLVDLINESGSAGYLSQLSIYAYDTTFRTLRIVVIVDGTTIYDFTSAAFNSSSSPAGAVLAGISSSTTNSVLPPIYYTNSIRVQYASSLTETGKFTISLARNKVT